MTATFPPRSNHPAQVALVLSAFAAVVDGPSALYVSTPLTTGERSMEWRASTKAADPADPAYREAFRRAVLEPNRDAAKAFVAQLRQKRDYVVIDPTGLADLAGWTQGDYRSLWAEVIERYVRIIVFRSGWEYSDGCAYEFYVAAGCGVRTAHQDFTPMTIEEGITLIGKAAMRKRAAGDSVEFALALLTAIRHTDHEPAVQK